MDEILVKYIERYFGLGSPEAKIWFVGMEEGGQPDKGLFFEGLSKWNDEGQPEFAELGTFLDEHENIWLSSERPPIQKTWGKLIRSVLVARGQSVTNDQISRFQARKMARSDGDMCLLELMPMPAKNLKNWPFASYSDLKFLQSRDLYMETIAPVRIERLKLHIQTHRPSAVVFYSTQYRQYWQKVVGENVEWSSFEGIQVATHDGVKFFCLPHPTAFGTKNELYDTLGRLISEVC